MSNHYVFGVVKGVAPDIDTRVLVVTAIGERILVRDIFTAKPRAFTTLAGATATLERVRLQQPESRWAIADTNTLRRIQGKPPKRKHKPRSVEVGAQSIEPTKYTHADHIHAALDARDDRASDHYRREATIQATMDAEGIPYNGRDFEEDDEDEDEDDDDVNDIHAHYLEKP